jgi:hypothetical protein
LQWIHWIQLVGTTAMVTLGYCPLIRLLSLAPFNRTEPLTISFVWRVFVEEPCCGGLVQPNGRSPVPSTGSCSVPTHTSSMACSLENHESNLRENLHASAH